MNSRERMLTAISGEAADHVPLSFMLFRALKGRTSGWKDFVERSLELGMDAVVDLRDMLSSPDCSDAAGVPVHFDPRVRVREWRERTESARYAILHKEYDTPAGTLTCAVKQTDDWPYGDHVGFLNDYIEPRAEKFPICTPDDLPALKYLLTEPTQDDIARCREAWAGPTQFAKDRGLLLSGGYGVAGDAAAWLFGLTNAVLTAVDAPDFLEALLDVIAAWNYRRMEVILEQEVDLFVRRGWYEGTSFWSPQLYRRFFLPTLKREVELVHQSGAKFGYIMTVGGLQFADMLREAGVDVLIGGEDVQDHGMDLGALKKKTQKKMSLWGGVNGFLTIEGGDESDIRTATQRAMEALGPGGFILSPVDNVRDPSAKVWENVLTFIDAWKDCAGLT